MEKPESGTVPAVLSVSCALAEDLIPQHLQMMIHPFGTDLWDAVDGANDLARFLVRFMNFECGAELWDAHRN